MSRFHEMDEQEDVVDYEDDYEKDIDDDDAVGEEGESAEAVEGGNSDSSADDLEPDSLAENGLPVAQTGEDSSDSDTVQISGEDADAAEAAADGGDPEIEEVFSRDANSNPVSRMSAASAVLPLSRSGGGSSRAESIMSRSSISYFVDLQQQQQQQQRDDASSSPRSSPAIGTCTSVAAALSQSMYATRSVSRESQGSVSFFVDISAESESNSRESPFTAKSPGVARNPAVAAPPKHTRRRQSIGDSQSATDEPVALITRAREHLKLTMTGPTLTKSEVRRKKLAVSKMEALLSEEEARLRRGEEPSNVNVVDVVLCDGSDPSRTGGGPAAPNRFHQQQLDQDTRQRPLSAYQQQRHAERNSGCENQVRVCVIPTPFFAEVGLNRTIYASRPWPRWHTHFGVMAKKMDHTNP